MADQRRPISRKAPSFEGVRGASNSGFDLASELDSILSEASLSLKNSSSGTKKNKGSTSPPPRREDKAKATEASEQHFSKQPDNKQQRKGLAFSSAPTSPKYNLDSTSKPLSFSFSEDDEMHLDRVTARSFSASSTTNSSALSTPRMDQVFTPAESSATLRPVSRTGGGGLECKSSPTKFPKTNADLIPEVPQEKERGMPRAKSQLFSERASNSTFSESGHGRLRLKKSPSTASDSIDACESSISVTSMQSLRNESNDSGVEFSPRFSRSNKGSRVMRLDGDNAHRYDSTRTLRSQPNSVEFHVHVSPCSSASESQVELGSRNGSSTELKSQSKGVLSSYPKFAIRSSSTPDSTGSNKNIKDRSGPSEPHDAHSSGRKGVTGDRKNDQTETLKKQRSLVDTMEELLNQARTAGPVHVKSQAQETKKAHGGGAGIRPVKLEESYPKPIEHGGKRRVYAIGQVSEEFTKR
eukprot:Colp12_sorted_trinity150504_noHs@30973